MASEDDIADALMRRAARLAADKRVAALDAAELRGITCRAIALARCIILDYHGQQRLLEVHIVGETTVGALAISGYQIGTDAKSTGWRRLRFDDIAAIALGDRQSLAPRPGYNRDDPGFAVVYCRVEDD